MSVAGVIEVLKGRVEELMARHGELEQRLAASSERERKLRTDNRQLNERITELEAQLKAAELKSGFGSGDTKRAEARIVSLMREIDKCIALVNKE